MIPLAALACGTHTTVDPHATGVELTIDRPADTAVDQARLSVSVSGTVTYGPVFLPEVPRTFDTAETLVVLLDASLDTQTVHLDVAGYSDGAGVATGGVDVVVSAKTLTPATVNLALITTTAPPVCGDGVCAPNENACTCVQDCRTACGDGCCSGNEKKSNCPQDCR